MVKKSRVKFQIIHETKSIDFHCLKHVQTNQDLNFIKSHNMLKNLYTGLREFDFIQDLVERKIFINYFLQEPLQPLYLEVDSNLGTRLENTPN